MEEGFNYPAGTGLAADPPWSGSVGTSVGVVNGNLTLTNLAASVPTGNMLQITGGTSRTVYRSFSSNAITGGAVYCSALIRCNLLPTNSQFIASLMPAGSTSRNRDTDPLALSVTSATGGYRFSLSSAGGDSRSGGLGLTVNSTHFIVLKYVFGSAGQASIYVDPTPGGVEPSSATITPEQGDSGTGAANLQVLLLQASSSVGQGIFNLDTVRIGTNWVDVTPKPYLLSLAGPQDQTVCFGSDASFSVLASGTPPFTYQWRTNGIVVANATNNTFTLNNPGASEVLKNFDVVVNDTFGSTTSRVARLAFTMNAAGIATQPVSQLVMPGISNVTFSVMASGDAPLSYQWRTNGIIVPAATNASYAFNNPGPADAAKAIDVVASNPCGSVTSSPPVRVVFPTPFYAAYDAGAGFFSGENLIFTNAGGISFYVWSTTDLSVLVPNWTLEGSMSELPLGTTGYSRYGINLNPVTSPTYYIFAQTNTGPYTATEPLVWLTTPDFASFTVTSSNVTISAAGLFAPDQFYAAYDAGAGFFSGENLIFTNASGISFNAWSSPDPAVPVANWTVEGPMSELPLGTSGESRYGINLNPQTSPAYYIFAQANTGNYTPTEPLVWLTTSDFASFSVTSSNVPISAGGIFDFPLPPNITQPPQSQAVLAGQNASFNVLAAGSGLGYRWLSNNSSISGAAAPALNLSNVSTASAGPYAVIVTNSFGSVTSSVATLTVVLPPVLNLSPGIPGTVQLNANSVTGLTYVVQTATNLLSPDWVPVLTNNTGSGGGVNFQTNTAGAGLQFYRLVFP